MTNRTPENLEIQITAAIEFMNRGFPYFDLHDFGVRVGKTADGSFGIVSIPPAPPPEVPAVPAQQKVADAAATLQDTGQMANIAEMIAKGDMDGIQRVLATAGVKLMLLTEGENSHGNTDNDPDGSPPTE